MLLLFILIVSNQSSVKILGLVGLDEPVLNIYSRK